MTGGGALFRRLVVALGTSRDSLAALATWADLAARTHADLSGLFVEDSDVMRMAGLPFAQVVGFGSVARAVDEATFTRLMRRAAADAQQALESHAGRRALRCSFRTVRGVAALALPANVERGDLLVLEHAVFGVAAWHALRDCDASVLYLRPEARHGGDVFALDGDVGVLAAAAQLAAASGRVLTLLERDGDHARRRAVTDSVAALVPPGVKVRVRALGAARQSLSGLLQATPGAILVASPGALAAALSADAIDPADPGCSILLVREGSAAA